MEAGSGRGRAAQVEEDVKARVEHRQALVKVAADDAADLNNIHLDLANIDDLDPTSWVRQYRPEASAGGYTLVLYRRRVPMVIDMNSRIVHVWPYVPGSLPMRQA